MENQTNMFLYAEMLALLKSQGRKGASNSLQLGVMQSATSVKIGDLILNLEDLYFAEHLLAGYAFPLATPYVDSVTFTESGGRYTTEKEAVRASGLQKGDIVAVMKLSDTNMYVILAKVVKA